MNSTIINKLVKDWAWRTNDGMPDPKNRDHLELLETTLRKYNYSEDFITEFISQISINEIDFADKDAYRKYRAKHNMRPSTKFTIGGKETTAGDEDKKDKPKEKAKATPSSGNKEIDAYQEETAKNRDKGIAGMGGAKASQGESRFCNAVDTLDEDKFRADNKEAIDQKVKDLEGKKLKVKEKADIEMNGLDPDSEEGRQYLAEREVWAEKELDRVKDDPDSVFNKDFKGKEEDYKEWMHAAYDGAKATRKVLDEDTPLDTSKSFKTIQSDSKVDAKVQEELQKKYDEAKGDDKKFYENQLKSFDKNKAYHDTYVVGKDENDRMTVVSISNKKSSELIDPQANTTPANRFQQIKDQYGEKVSKRVTDSLDSNMEDVKDAKKAGIKAGNKVDIDDEIVKVCELPIMKKYMDKLDGHRGFNKWLEGQDKSIEDLSTKEKLKLSQEFSAKELEEKGKVAYEPFGKIYTKVGEFTKVKKFEKENPDIDIAASEAIANCIDIKAKEKSVVESSYQNVLSDIEKADKEGGHDGEGNGPHAQGYIATVMKAMHFDSYIDSPDGNMVVTMGGRAVQPSQVRSCLADLSGFKGDSKTPEGRKGLKNHILKNSKIDATTGALTINSPSGKRELATDVWRTAGTSQKVASGIGSNMRGCLKNKVDIRRRG